MKRKGIILSFIGIIVISIFLIIFTSKNNKKYIMQDGITLALTLDGEKITEFPTDTNYTVDIDCQNATGSWLVEDWKLSVSNITGNVICNIDFKTRTDEDKIVNVVENEATEFEGGKKPNSSTYTMLTESEYVNAINGDPGTSLDSSWPLLFNSSTSKWYVTVDSNSLGKMSFYPPENGFYQICYDWEAISSGYSNQIQIYDINTKNDFAQYSSVTAQNSCVDLGYMTTSDYVFFTLSTSRTSANVYFKKNVDVSDLDAGYRYSGKNPNNYIWFNNEMWRIIGSVPTCMDSSCSSIKNLVKIIRDNPIGNLSYGGQSNYSSPSDTYRWGGNLLYTLLNSYYYGAKNGTNSGYCYIDYSSSSSNTATTCDYTNKGITTDGYYGKMVEPVYWNIGHTSLKKYATMTYSDEWMKHVSGHVGLLTLSDLAYSGNVSHNSNYVSNSLNTSWLYSEGEELTSSTIMRYYSRIKLNSYYRGSNTSLAPASSPSGNVRPVVYLDPDVYVVSGDGTEANPYQVAM